MDSANVRQQNEQSFVVALDTRSVPTDKFADRVRHRYSNMDLIKRSTLQLVWYHP